MDGVPRLMTSAEVAALFRVHQKTISRWVKAGRLTERRTPGGQLRFDAAEVKALLRGHPGPGPTPSCPEAGPGPGHK